MAEDTKVQKVFKKWIKFMNDNGPMGKDEDQLRTDDFTELCLLIEKEMNQLREDRENFNCGAMN
jgi:hypothetical protein